MVESAKNSCGKSDSHLRTNFRMVSLGNLLYSLGYATIGTIYCVLGSLLMILVILKLFLQ